MGNQCSIQTETCGGKCTGYDGSHRWKQMHEIVEGIECDSCRQDGIKSFSGYHDFVNVRIGEKPFDEPNFLEFCDQVACTKASYCKRTGRC